MNERTLRAADHLRPLLPLLVVLALMVVLVPQPPGAAGADASHDDDPVLAERLAGADRTHTAAAISAATFADGADVVMLARSDGYPDALAAAPLARVLGAPILLTGGSSLDEAPADELRRLEPREVVVLGGEGALSDALLDEVRALGVSEVSRISGSDRFATAARVAERLAAAEAVEDAYLVLGAHEDPGSGWPDAVAISSLAAWQGRPVLLTEHDRLPAATETALESLGVERVIVVGGPAAVSKEVVAELFDAGFSVQRLAGADRYETSLAVAAVAIGVGMTLSETWVATGRSYPDALAAGPAAARTGRVMVLVDGQQLSAESRTWFEQHATDISAMTIAGGAAAISTPVEDEMLQTINNSDDPDGAAGGGRLLYSGEDVEVFQHRMGGGGPFFAVGDAGHGGEYSPGDGERSLGLAAAFLEAPQESYWSQPDLPLSAGDPWPNHVAYVRPLHAAWVWMTQPTHPQRDDLAREVKRLLLAHATDPTHDFSDAVSYPVDFPGSAQSPIFAQAQWMTRLMKARDMLGRDAFTDVENETLDRWMYDYANWTAHWLHLEIYSKQVPDRLARDYSTVRWSESADRHSFDGGPLIGAAARAYSNRHAAVASAMSLAANYLAHFDYQAPGSGPSYGTYTVEELVDHSRLFVEETVRFSVFPEGLQGDFERGRSDFPQLGWLYSANVLANLVEMAEYHARRGDMSVWDYATTAGHDGTAGVPVAGGFEAKNLHFFAWSMSRYVNDGWGRRNFGEPIALAHYYHDVIPAAVAHRFAPEDELLEAAWKRDGHGFPAYPQHPQNQAMWDAHLGEAAKMIGLIEHGGLPTITP